ncbi:MAG: ATP-binding protein [Rhodospirillales bacterium]
MNAGRLFRTTAFRLAALYGALFAVSVAALFGFLYWRTLSLIDAETDAAIASEIAGLNEQYRQRGMGGLVRVVAERSAAQPDGANIYLLTRPDFTPLAGNLKRWPAEARRTQAGIVFDLKGEEDAGVGSARARIFALDGNFRLLVGRDLRQREKLRGLVTEALGWGLAATLALGLMAALLVGRKLLQRVEAINRIGQRIVGGELKQRVAVTGAGDEFDRLAENLNAMLDQIERLMTGMREVTDNIAHDLRGPLTRLKSRLELALLARQDPSRDRAAIESAIAETDRLLATFNALLSIAEAESGVLHQSMQPVELGALAADVAELYAPALEEKGLALATDIGDCPAVMGSRQLLFQAIANLLETAMKYPPGAPRSEAARDLSGAPGGSTSGGGRVGLVVAPMGSPSGAGAALTVWDTGPGIPAELRGRVLERYVRLDQARTTPGSGLGLSMVAAVAKLHGAKLELGDNNPGLKVTLTFPPAAAQAQAQAKTAPAAAAAS